MSDMSVMELKINQAFKTYINKSFIALDLEQELIENQSKVEYLFGPNKENKKNALAVFNIGRHFPIERLGVYGNVLKSCVTVENWF